MGMTHTTNAVVKESITQALLILMEDSPLSKISITSIVQKAGVGRVSFYRNFESKKNVLEQHLLKLLQEWGKSFENQGNPQYFSESLLDHYYSNKDFYLLLYKHGLSTMVYETIRRGTKVYESQNNLERYGKSMLAGMLFGYVDEWIRQGMQETPKEMVTLWEQHHKTNHE